MSLELFEVAGIRNFGWVEPGLVARGEQPVLEEATFVELHKLGIRAVLSLRPDREAPPAQSRRSWPEYHLEEEQRLADCAGLRFSNVPIADFSAPSPDQMAMALTALDMEVANGPAVYVHCRAGAGRAGIVTGAWAVASGRTGDHAASMYQRYMEHIAAALGRPQEEWPAMFQRVGQPQMLWALREVVRTLGSPVTGELSGLLPPQPPAGVDGWAAGYGRVLRRWRDRRAERLASNDPQE
jgi:protein tyrosine phosphatase (PTP) superfamily phosphohydrolase (DUF442 family)